MYSTVKALLIARGASTPQDGERQKGFVVGGRIGVDLLESDGSVVATVVNANGYNVPKWKVSLVEWEVMVSASAITPGSSGDDAWAPAPAFCAPFPWNHHEFCPVADLLGMSVRAKVSFHDALDSTDDATNGGEPSKVTEITDEELKEGEVFETDEKEKEIFHIYSDSCIISAAPELISGIQKAVLKQKNFGFHSQSTEDDTRLVVLTSPADDGQGATDVEVRAVPEDDGQKMKVLRTGLVIPCGLSTDVVRLSHDDDRTITLLTSAAGSKEESSSLDWVTVCVKTRKDRDNLALFLRSRHYNQHRGGDSSQANESVVARAVQAHVLKEGSSQ